MTTQPPEPERLHHLLDRLLHGVILPDEAEQLAALVREQVADLHRYEEVVVGDLNEANIRLQRQAAEAAEQHRQAHETETENTAREIDRALADEARVRELEAEVNRLTAGQCTHTGTP